MSYHQVICDFERFLLVFYNSDIWNLYITHYFVMEMLLPLFIKLVYQIFIFIFFLALSYDCSFIAAELYQSSEFKNCTQVQAM